MTDSPITLFNRWWDEAKKDSPLKHPNPVCVSTINDDGYPSGRFVDLKAADENGFVFCTYLDSAKGTDINRNPKVALTIWWDHVGYQIRVLGKAAPLSSEKRDDYWVNRSRDAQITTSAFKQSNILTDATHLSRKFENARAIFDGIDVPRPENWGGYIIAPVSIEFLTLRDTRLHLREYFEAENGVWKKELLQP